jgi:hypothetical protein
MMPCLRTLLRTLCFFLAAMLAPSASSAQSLGVGETAAPVGTFLELPDGNQLQLFVEDQRIVSYFVDSGNRVIPSMASSILLVITQPGHREDDWRSVLEPVDGVKLTSGRRIFGPYAFRARVIIRFTGGEPLAFHKASLNLEANP